MRNNQRRRNKTTDSIKLPITVRQAQKLLNSEENQILAIKLIRREIMKDENYSSSYNFTDARIQEIKNLLNKLASKDPNQVLIDPSTHNAIALFG